MYSCENATTHQKAVQNTISQFDPFRCIGAWRTWSTANCILISETNAGKAQNTVTNSKCNASSYQRASHCTIMSKWTSLHIKSQKLPH